MFRALARLLIPLGSLKGVALVIWFVVLLCGLATPEHWPHTAEAIWIAYWPLLLPAVASLLLTAWVLYQRDQGRGVTYRFVGWVGVLVALGVFAYLATLWGVGYSMLRGGLAVGIFGLAAFPLSLSWFALAQPWRRPAVNRVVVQVVLQHLRQPWERFRLDLERIRRGDWTPIGWLSAGWWGSPHCLRIIREHYEATRQILLTRVGGSPTSGQILNYLHAGRALSSYLALSWVEEVLPAAKRSWQTAEILREMITLSLWFQRFSRGSIRIPQRYIADWIATLDEEKETLLAHELAPLADYFDGLIQLFRLHLEDASTPAEKDVITEMVSRSRRLGSAEETTFATSEELRRTLACTWLALAGWCYQEELVLDVWCALTSDLEGELYPPVPEDEPDAARGCAGVMLALLYLALARSVPTGWNTPLDGCYRFHRACLHLGESGNE